MFGISQDNIPLLYRYIFSQNVPFVRWTSRSPMLNSGRGNDGSESNSHRPHDPTVSRHSPCGLTDFLCPSNKAATWCLIRPSQLLSPTSRPCTQMAPNAVDRRVYRRQLQLMSRKPGVVYSINESGTARMIFQKDRSAFEVSPFKISATPLPVGLSSIKPRAPEESSSSGKADLVRISLSLSLLNCYNLNSIPRESRERGRLLTKCIYCQSALPVISR